MNVVGIHHPVLVLPPETARIAQIREALKLPAALPAEGFGLMSKDWRFSSEKAKRELGYTSRPIDETIGATVEWYCDLIADGVFEEVTDPDARCRAIEVIAPQSGAASVSPDAIVYRIRLTRTSGRFEVPDDEAHRYE